VAGLKRTDKEAALLLAWQTAWPDALAVWSPYTRLSEPNWCFTAAQEKEDGLHESFAAIRLNDHRILISLRQVEKYDLGDYGLEILAHEIGHHVFCPGNLLEAGRASALALLGLPTFEHMAPMIVNLWEDLLINDRLVRVHGQRHYEVYERLNRRDDLPSSKLWHLYMRVYELLWGLRPGRLSKGPLEASEEGDAHLVARMVRVYGEDWLAGVGGFAALCLPYLQRQEEKLKKHYRILFDTDGMGEGCEVPLGILELDDYDIVHPSQDPNIVGGALEVGVEEESEKDSEFTGASESEGGGLGQNREPFLFGQVLEALGLKLNAHDAAVKFYREKALPHLIPFPTQETEESKEPLMEGLEPWDVGNPMDEVDWMQSVLISPVPIPGMTTVRRTWGVMGGHEREREPLDLDLYVDCSGSIPNPQTQFSFLALAGAIVVISALRTGARVQATLWSGSRQFDTTPGFISNETAILRVLTGYLGGGTAFPNHILRDTYSERRESDRPVHILILSDEGIDTMGNPDEKGNPGMELSEMALQKARGGGTMVLNLWSDQFLQGPFAKASKKLGWEMFGVRDWSGLLEFAREFSKRKYGQRKAGRS
jgi:hypothetical protein